MVGSLAGVLVGWKERLLLLTVVEVIAVLYLFLTA